MNIGNRLKIISNIIKEYGINAEPSEILNISEQVDVKDYDKVAKYFLYAEYRLIHKMSRYEAFKKVFPERCVVSLEKDNGKFKTNKPVGSELSKSSIEIKAKRLENSKLYKSIIGYLTTSFYTMYALDRIKVMDLVLDKIMDEKIKEVHRIEYVKMFLQETRKPDDKGMEINVNLQQNNISIENVEKKIDMIAEKLNGLDAQSVINLISTKGDNDGN